MEKELREIPINQIAVKENYRKTFNEKSQNELAQSIRENGVIQPIVVRTKSNGNGKSFQLIAGERRLKAAQIAGLATIPSVIRDVDDADFLKLQIIENVQREGVSFMEEAFGLAKLRDDHALDVSEICKIVGKSDGWVYQTLALTRMHGEAQRMATNGFISKPVAVLISRLKSEEDQCKAASDLARTQKGKLVDIRFARRYVEEKIEANGRPKMRTVRNGVQKQNGNDFCANWKKYLVNFSTIQFEYFKAIVRGRTDVATISEAVESVMLEKSGGGVDTYSSEV